MYAQLFNLPAGQYTELRFRTTDLDEVLQISNVFVNVSKGEVAKTNELKKAFNTTDVNTVVLEVRLSPLLLPRVYRLTVAADPSEGRAPGWRQGARTRSDCSQERARDAHIGEMRRSRYEPSLRGVHD